MPTVQSGNQRIAYQVSGTGPPVVLGHSFLCSGTMWRHQVPALAERYRVLNLDLRGHGKSGQVAAPFSLYDAVADVVAVLDEEGIDQAVWCGLSIGGMVAMRAALTCPERVRALILMDTDAGTEVPLAKLKYRAMGAGARLMGLKPFLGPVAQLMFGPTTHRDRPDLVQELRRELATLHVPSILHGLDALLRRDSLLDRLDRIRVPALVVVGAEDRSLKPPVSRRIHERLPDSELVEIPGAGHLSALEQPEAVNRAVLDFLSRRTYFVV